MGDENSPPELELSQTVDRNDLADVIRRLHCNLLRLIDTRHGLINELRSLKVLTHEQVEIIDGKPTPSGESAQLLEYLINMSHETQRNFLLALEKTQQQHICNYIQMNGQRASDDWPLLESTNGECNMLDSSWSKLIDLIDSRNGLLDEMLSNKCINNRHRQSIECKTNDAQRNEAMLCILRLKSVTDYNNFIRCLVNTKQHQVVQFLTTDADYNVEILNAEIQNKLNEKQAALIAILETKNGLLLTEMLSAGCITWRQKEFIDTAASQSESNTRLLDIVRRSSQPDFEKFLKCLDETGQHHVNDILMENWPVAHIVARTNKAAHIKAAEDQLVNKFASLYKYSSSERREEIRGTTIKFGVDIQLIAVDTEHSIGLYFMCKTLDGLHYLYELYSSGELKVIVEELFALLLKNYPTIDVLLWKMSNYSKCAAYFTVFLGLPVLTEAYRQLQYSYNDPMVCGVSSFEMEKLPHELVEMLLIKATGRLFITLNRNTSLAEVYTMALLSTVSMYWWRTLTYRKYIKKVIKTYFRQVCFPYKCSQQQLSNIHIECARHIVGVTEWKSKLYVICTGSNIIQVFNSSPPSSRIEDVIVEGLNAPRDIAVCTDTSQLYIVDWVQRAIWRVNLLSYKQIDKFITTPWMPWSLSMKYTRLLITPFDGSALFIYGDDGVQLNYIPLPRYMLATHAVESSQKTYFVIHGKRFTGDTNFECKDGISEIDINGCVVRQFNNQLNVNLQFNRPHYLMLDSFNNVLVADTYNERIVLLTPDLKFKRVLIPSLKGQPWRMFLSKESGLISIGFLNLNDIHIYCV